MMKIVIIGAGLAGSIAAGALSGYNPIVIDAGSKEVGGLSNHYAVMRMRDPNVTKYLGCDSTEVSVDKAIFFNGCLHDKPSIAMNNLYSMKAYGQLGDRSLKSLGTVKRYLFDDLERIKPANVQYDSLVTMFDQTGQNIEIGSNKWLSYDACISTIPMSAIIKLCNLSMPRSVPSPSFRFRPIEVVTSKVNFVSTVHQTIYFPE
jgi:protoporphyrinogen oxidase